MTPFERATMVQCGKQFLSRRQGAPKTGFVLIAAAAVATTACSGEIPIENGVKWECTTEVRNGGQSNSLVIGGHPSPDGPLFLCLNANTSLAEVASECEDKCKNAWCGYGDSFLGDIGEALFCNASCFFVGNPTADMNTQCRDPTDPGGPARADLAVSGSAIVTAEGESGFANATGILRYSVPDDCAGPDCPLMFAFLELTIPNFDLDGTTVNAHILSGNNAMGIWHPSNSTYDFAPGALLIGANFNLDDDHGSIRLANNMMLSGVLDPNTDSFSFSGEFTVDNITVNIVSLTGTHTNRPPVAVIQPTGTIECNTAFGADVTFDADESTDPDANIALDRFGWIIGTETSFPTSQTQATTLPMGPTDVGLLVLDSKGSAGDHEETVVVVDETAPSIVAPPDIFQEACDTEGAVVDPGTPTVTDVCDPNPDVSARIIEINGVPTDQPLVPGQNFTQGVTVIEYSATDFSGQTSTDFQVVTLDFGPSCCPADLEVIIGTAGNDDISGGNKGQCIAGLAGDDRLAGDNQAEVIFCGPGDDVCIGGNQGDLIRGGIGDDTIVGGNGKDGLPNGLWGGPGNDPITGGNGKDYIRGGAGADTMLGGNGNDVFVIAAACEAVAGEIIDGGAGVDTLESPISLAELQAAGVVIQNVEVVVITPALPDAECVDP